MKNYQIIKNLEICAFTLNAICFKAKLIVHDLLFSSAAERQGAIQHCSQWISLAIFVTLYSLLCELFLELFFELLFE